MFATRGVPASAASPACAPSALVLVLAPIMLAVVVLDGHARRGAPRRLARRLATRECWRVCGGAETARSWRENAPVRRARAQGNPPQGGDPRATRCAPHSGPSATRRGRLGRGPLGGREAGTRLSTRQATQRRAGQGAPPGARQGSSPVSRTISSHSLDCQPLSHDGQPGQQPRPTAPEAKARSQSRSAYHPAYRWGYPLRLAEGGRAFAQASPPVTRLTPGRPLIQPGSANQADASASYPVLVLVRAFALAPLVVLPRVSARSPAIPRGFARTGQPHASLGPVSGARTARLA